jgi:hypothetical protein
MTESPPFTSVPITHSLHIDMPSETLLAPIEAVDVASAYRKNVGPFSRGTLFVFRYFPLTIAYTFYGTLFLQMSAGETLIFMGLGLAGDVLRWRFAPDLLVENRDWVSFYCDGAWSEAAGRIYARWYSGLEIPVISAYILYLVFIFSAFDSFRENSLDEYMNYFSPLHEWTRQHLPIAREHAADLAVNGRARQIIPLLHFATVVVFAIPLILFLTSIGGNCWSIKGYVKYYNEAVTKNTAYKYIDKTRIASSNYILFRIISISFIYFIIIFILYTLENTNWNNCISDQQCFLDEYYTMLFSFIFAGIAKVSIFSVLLNRSLMVKAWSIRFEQISLGEKNNANT